MKILLKEIETSLDCFDVYSIYKNQKDIMLLDSGTSDSNLARYSFVGVNPFLVLKGRNNKCNLNGLEYECSPYEKLSEVLKKYRCENHTEIPFIGGCIGYFSYDLGLELEDINSISSEDLIIPHFYFVFYDNIIIFDNSNRKKYISACGITNNHEDSIALIEKAILNQKKVEYGETDGLLTREWDKRNEKFESNFVKDEYIKTISRTKEYIRAGDIYIANLTQRFTATTQKGSYDIYRDLRKINPAPFAAFLRLEDFDVISSSPERFLKIQDNWVETRPIKGTRPRGKDSLEDEFNRNELLNSDKDKAELLMIVDLERNDLSKVCKPHSVKVTELFKLEEYSTVFHLVSTVVGELRDSVDSVECMKACFPGGSITGTPKIRAMEIIDELEGLKRNLYTGCIGYFSFDGNGDFNIAIRTIIKKDNRVYFGVGGGITWDSKEEEEYQETLDKARALMGVI